MYARKKLTPFQQALVDSVLMEYEDIPMEADLPDLYSDEFKAWANRLIAKTKHNSWYYVNTAAKKAILVAIIVSLLTISALAVPTVRQAIINFFNHGNRYGVSFDPAEGEAAPDVMETIYRPSYIPSSYLPQVEKIGHSSMTLAWRNSNNEIIRFVQQVIPNSGLDNWIGIDAEESSLGNMVIGEYHVIVVDYENGRTLYWTDNAYFFSLRLPSSINDKELHRIFTSIVLAEA